MGMAKVRGNRDQRIALAKERDRASLPQSVDCNDCGAALTNIQALDVRGLSGLRHAGGARCEACGSTTWVLDGTQEAVRRARDYFGRAGIGIPRSNVIRNTPRSEDRESMD